MAAAAESAIACRECGRMNVAEARFCSACGAAIVAPKGDDPLIGTTLEGRYRIARLLGEGGMGAVYLADQPMGTTTRKVAVKVLKGASTAAARARFQRECETVVQLAHPNTIRFYDFGSLPDGRLYIAMEYVEGRTLTRRIEDGPLPHATVDRLVTQIGGALAEAHKRGIIHRDLKPDNVLLLGEPGDDDDTEHAKVLDFGIAKRRDDEGSSQPNITAAGTIVGTPAYMSPEQLSGMEVDARSDLYALGLITFEMLTGRRPFQGKSPLEWATQHMTAPVPSFDDFPTTRLLSPEKRAAILRALAKDPKDRQPTVRRFVEELTGAVTGTGSSSGSGPMPRVAGLRNSEAMAPTTPAGIPIPAHGARRTAGSLALVGVAALLGAASVVGTWWYVVGSADETPGETPVLDAGVRTPDAGADAGPPAPTVEWLQIVTSYDDVDDPSLALGAPDGRCAVLRPNGKILFELTAGMTRRGDGTAEPELHVYVDDERPGPYRVDVSTSRGTNARFINVASDLVGSAPLDVDQVHAGEYRYIRIKNRDPRRLVCIDAVGVYLR